MVKGIQHIATTESGGVPLGEHGGGPGVFLIGASSSCHNILGPPWIIIAKCLPKCEANNLAK